MRLRPMMTQFWYLSLMVLSSSFWKSCASGSKAAGFTEIPGEGNSSALRGSATARRLNLHSLHQPNYHGKEGMWCVGINAVGFDLHATSGRHATFDRPSHEALKYFYDQGANCIRLPITWERLQARLGDEHLDLVDGVIEVVEYITEVLNSHVIIDPHNNNQGLQYNGKDANAYQFVNLWKAIARKWGGHPRVIFGLYNEPRYGHERGRDGYFDPDAVDHDGEQIRSWFDWMQTAIDAIRELGADNLILVPGLHWTGSRDWSGAMWWGEEIDGDNYGGNTRLAALKDPKMRIAYDVHQYMDPHFTGEAHGCAGHWRSEWGGGGADWGLLLSIDWAKRYNKKLMMTEIGSWPKAGSERECEELLYRYLQRMDESGVFLGYQVWQFGCHQCMADQWSERPYNLHWYQFHRYGRGASTCSRRGQDCRSTMCCENGDTCFVKNEHWAHCYTDCQPGIHPDDPEEHRTTWECSILAPFGPPPSPSPTPTSSSQTPYTTTPPDQCSSIGENCRGSTCCKDTDRQCYKKNDHWAACLPACVPGLHADDHPKHQTPWDCEVLSVPPSSTAGPMPANDCSDEGENCHNSLCCKDDLKKCYRKNEHWATCLSICVAGVHEDDHPEHKTPWDCKALSTPTLLPPPFLTGCSGDGEDCRSTLCCTDIGKTCYEKNGHWAGCLADCAPGIHEHDPAKHRTPWTCARVGEELHA